MRRVTIIFSTLPLSNSSCTTNLRAQVAITFAYLAITVASCCATCEVQHCSLLFQVVHSHIKGTLARACCRRNTVLIEVHTLHYDVYRKSVPACDVCLSTTTTNEGSFGHL